MCGVVDCKIAWRTKCEACGLLLCSGHYDLHRCGSDSDSDSDDADGNDNQIDCCFEDCDDPAIRQCPRCDYFLCMEHDEYGHKNTHGVACVVPRRSYGKGTCKGCHEEVYLSQSQLKRKLPRCDQCIEENRLATANPPVYVLDENSEFVFRCRTCQVLYDGNRGYVNFTKSQADKFGKTGRECRRCQTNDS